MTVLGLITVFPELVLFLPRVVLGPWALDRLLRAMGLPLEDRPGG